MFNLIKMDLYRLVHSKVTWVILIFVVGIGIFATKMTDYDIETMKQEMETGTYVDDMVSGEVEPGSIAVVPDEEWASGKVEAGSMVSSQVESRILLIFITVFTVLFVNAKQKNGYIKNIAGLFPKREKLVIAEALVVAFQVLLMMITFILTILICGKVFWGEGFYMGDFSAFVKFSAVQYLLHLGFAMIMFFLCQLTRSSALSITAGMIIATGMTTIIYALINRGISGIDGLKDFDITKYVIENNITATGVASADGDMVRAFVTAAVFTVLFTGLAAFFMRKRDIR